MKYFLGTELIDGVKEKRVLWFKVKTEPTIDLISIGIKAKDGREYYAISKDFNLKEAWNRYDIKKEWYSIDESNQSTRDIKVYWIRDNVLKPIWEELMDKEYNEISQYGNNKPIWSDKNFTYKKLKRLINKYGKTNKQIAEEIKDFWSEYPRVKFYCSYSEWATLARLYDIKLGKYEGYLKYCVDLKQMLDYFENNIKLRKENNAIEFNSVWNKIDTYKQHPNYPKQTNENHALSQARFNYELYKFIQQI